MDRVSPPHRTRDVRPADRPRTVDPMTKQATLFSATLGEDKKVEPPLGPLYIASALQEVGWEVDFRDYQTFEGADSFHPEFIVECLDGHAAVVMISCFVDMLP